MNMMVNTTEPKLVIILGPTASGKSDLGMELARRFNGEIIAADSRTVYRGMDIGTAKPSLGDQTEIQHWGLDLVEPNEPFNAAQFKAYANAAVANIAGRGKLPIMVGGTGLYIDAVLYDYRFPTGDDIAKRSEYAAMGVGKLLELLQINNPDKYAVIDHANKRRIIRALENNQNNENKSGSPRPQTLVLGLELNKEIIQSRIELRAKKMLSKGIIEEVRRTGETFGWDSEAMSGIIYRVFKMIAQTGENNPEIIEAALAEFIASDKKLVKKQLTWFRRSPHITWLNAADPAVLVAQADGLVRTFVATDL